MVPVHFDHRGFADSVRAIGFAKLQRALGDTANDEAFEAALRDHSDVVIRKALAATLAVPDAQIRRSRTALFIYLLKRHANAS